MSQGKSGLRILFGERSKEWKWVVEQLPFTTPDYIARKLVKLAYDEYGESIDPNNLEQLVVWDMFAGLGVDAINFAKVGFKVYATELLQYIYNFLQTNIKTMKMEDNIIEYNSDCCDKLEEINADIYYFDPPWGDTFVAGKPFDFSEVKLSNEMLVLDLLKKIAEKSQNIIIKAPLMCETFEELDYLTIDKIYIFRKHKLKFIFCKEKTD